MSVETTGRRPPSTVSIILPTYNREAFLQGAFESLTGQSFTDWELIVVDDGSSDDTRGVVTRFSSLCARPVTYLFQENRGPAAARNAGLDAASGTYIAFFDSDDLWLPAYLERSVEALEQNSDVDWVFSPCSMVELPSGKILAPSTFYENGRRRPFLGLRAERRRPGIDVIVDPRALEYQLVHGLYCGPQNSVIRRSLFETARFPEQLRVGEDQLLVISALASGRRFGYFSEPQVLYRIHDQNSSASQTGNSADKLISVLRPLVGALADLESQLTLTRRERRALRKRLAREYFWHLGYSGYWQNGRSAEALEMFERGLMAWPWYPSAWKTYLLARLKTTVQRAGS